MELDIFTRQYLITALWSSMDESTPEGGEPMDKHYSIEHFAPETLAAAIADCDKFQADNADDIAADPSLAGHDFWLTRNHHGAGFWDGDWPEGERLTEASQAYREVNLYIGDDGKIYA